MENLYGKYIRGISLNICPDCKIEMVFWRWSDYNDYDAYYQCPKCWRTECCSLDMVRR